MRDVNSLPDDVERAIEDYASKSTSTGFEMARVVILSAVVFTAPLIGGLAAYAFRSGWPIGITLGLVVAWGASWKLSSIEGLLAEILKELRRRK